MKPRTLKGTRDFGPEVVVRRNYIFDTIKAVFVKYGYQPIETPAMEYLDTLTGKYGEEGDRLLFKILNNGEFLKKADPEALRQKDEAAVLPKISKRGLRYDLTVPFARFVVLHQNDLVFPFKRYQIQPVWRADRPQANRYQEFFQCDVDVVGSDSLVYEAELVQIYDEAFADLNLEVIIKINNRKVLAGIAEAAGIPDQFMDMTIAIDKIDKIGIDGVRKEMQKKDIPDTAIDKIESILQVKTLDELKPHFADSPTGQEGIKELEQFHLYFDHYQPKNTVAFDIALARGLNYYTGCIFEVKAKGADVGSIGGGGRYADLTSVFGMKNMPGVGVSFGADRIYDAMEALDAFPDSFAGDLQLLFVALDEQTHPFAYQQLLKVREAGINADIYPEPAKMKKQMKYADDRNVPYVIIIGSNEMQSGELSFKDMASGEQVQLPIEKIIEKLS
ncbi:MAG TPA: histidine--tRNA ligase [Saprospiraceae bacterium]|nr:histidine--tRNA ligase [Saprospiraceae bacterium]